MFRCYKKTCITGFFIFYGIIYSVMNWISNFLSNTAFIWVPIILGSLFWHVRKIFFKEKFLFNKVGPKKYTMLEINIPRNVHKSPKAMELAIDVLWNLGGGAMAWQDRLWYGAVFYPSSLEIISVEGSIYFFVRTHDQVTELIKSTIYSQYPQAEINEVDDYTKYVPDFTKHEDTWDLYGVNFKLSQADFIPIKTYVDYELDKNVGSLEEEQKIDPITPFLEYLGTLKKGEQIWVQILVRPAIFNGWRKRAKAHIEEIMKRALDLDDTDPTPNVKLTHGEQEQIKAIERSLDKHGFETKIRAIYIAPKKYFNGSRVGFFKNNVFKPFNSMYLNGFLRNDDTTYVDYVWQDITGRRTPALKRRFFKDYVEREAFYESWTKYINFIWHAKKEPMVLTSEELATLFHIPGQVAETTAIERIEATKSEPPSNLPL